MNKMDSNMEQKTDVQKTDVQKTDVQNVLQKVVDDQKVEKKCMVRVPRGGGKWEWIAVPATSNVKN